MTFNGLTDSQAEKSRKKHGSNRQTDDSSNYTLKCRLVDRFNRVPVKIYIIILLIYTAYALILALTGYEAELDNLWKVLLTAPVIAASMLVNCFAELYFDRRSLKIKRRTDEEICHVYRCGNTIKDIPSGDIVKGDYVLVQEGDVVPADAMVVYGDITAESDSGSKLVRNYKGEDSGLTIEQAVYRGDTVSSGFAVIKISSVGTDSDDENIPLRASKSRSLSYITAAVPAAAITALYVLCCLNGGAYGADFSNITAAAVVYTSLFVLASESIRWPSEFFKNAYSNNMYKNGVRAASLKGTADIVLADKTSFITDGRPAVTGFTDGEGHNYSKCYEIPYPLGTILSTAVVSGSSSLVNRERIIGPDIYENAAVKFISERIKSTRELEVNQKNINGAEKDFGFRKLISGSPEKIIGSCTAYFDGSGGRKNLSNTAPLSAMADELAFQGSRVIAYAAEEENGKRTFIGMLTLHEKLKSTSPAAYRALTENGTRLIMLTGSSSSEYLSIADKAVTSASANEVISAEKLDQMDEDEIRRILPAIKIITGDADKEKLVEIAKKLKYTVGVTITDYRDCESCAEADVLYASSVSCEAAKDAADAVLYDGIMSMFRYGIFCRSIKNSAAVYVLIRQALMIFSALAMSVYAESIIGFAAWYIAAALNILLSALTVVVSGKSAGAELKADHIIDKIKENDRRHNS